jgi:hypothetical protein
MTRAASPTRSELLGAATQSGYRADGRADRQRYHVAQVLMDGGYRPCGRPFINTSSGPPVCWSLRAAR